MPIRYETPAPITAGTLQSIAGAAQGAAGGGGGGDARLQAAVLQAAVGQQQAQADFALRNMMFNQGQELEAAQFAASRQYSPRDAGMAQAEMAQQQQRAQLQAWLNQEELSQGEALRLQRLKQGEVAVKEQLAQGVITENEAYQMIGQMRMGPAGVQALEARKTLTQIKAMELEQKQVEQRIKFAEETQQRAATFRAKGFAERVALFPDPGMVADVQAELAQDARFVNLPPEVQKAIVHDTVRKRGGLIKMYEKQPGQFEPLPGSGSAGDGKAKSAADLAAEEQKGAVEDWERAHKVAQREAQMKAGKEGAISVEEVRKAAQEHFDYLQGIRRRGQGGQQQQAPAAKPFNPNSMEDANDEQRARVGQINSDIERVKTHKGLEPAARDQLMQDLAELRSLWGKYGSKAGLQQRAAAGDRQAVADLQVWQFVDRRILQNLPPDLRPKSKEQQAAEMAEAAKGMMRRFFSGPQAPQGQGGEPQWLPPPSM